MWILASLPFWLLGIVLMGLAIVGMYASIKKRDPELGQCILGFCIIMTVAGLLFVVAAKVAA